MGMTGPPYQGKLPWCGTRRYFAAKKKAITLASLVLDMAIQLDFMPQLLLFAAARVLSMCSI